MLYDLFAEEPTPPPAAPTAKIEDGRYALREIAYPGVTVWTVFDTSASRHVYGRSDRALSESVCAALSRGESPDLSYPVSEAVKPKKTRKTKAEAPSQTGIEDD
jgi:hypothetical protein